MLCREIIDVIEGTYPKEAALAWDNVGLLVGRTEKEVKRNSCALHNMICHAVTISQRDC